MIIRSTVDIAAEPKHVWAVMSDVERWPEWTSSVTNVELLDRGPLGVGSRVRIRQPRLPVALWTVTSIEPERYFAWRSVTPGLTSVATHRIEPLGPERSRVDLAVEWSGLLARLINLVYGGLSRRYVATEAQGLKGRCEATNIPGRKGASQ
jgi:hypothetical protein